MAATVGTLDSVNLIPAKMRALGVSNIELFSMYCNQSPTSLRRVLNGAPGSAEKLEQLNRTLSELAALAEAVWPVPIDFRQVGQVRFLQARLKAQVTQIINSDSGSTNGPSVTEPYLVSAS
jgi:hypothetical protein